MFTLTKRLLATLAVFAMLATGCGSSSNSSTDAAESADIAESADDGATDASGDDSSDESGEVTTGEAAEEPAAEGGDAPEEAMEDDAMEEEAMADEADSAAAPEVEGRSATDEADEAVSPEPLPEPEQPRPQSGLLTAADVDDNLNYDFFLGYLDRTAQQYGQSLPIPNLSDRITVNVVDTNGVGIANTAVQFEADQGIPPGVVYTDATGTARFFPNFTPHSWNGTDIRAAGTSVKVTSEQLAEGPLVITADDAQGGAPDALDISFVLDVTGSMSDELRYLTVEFDSIVERLQGTYPDADLRFSLVSYRDVGDEFVTQVYDFTSDVAEMQSFLAEQQAAGGGDYPEAMDAAMADANALSWREGNVGRIMILNADAPPHDEDLARTLGLTQDAADRGIRIYPLAASGVGDTAEYMMRVMAATTGGRHMFLTGDSGIGGEKQEPKTQCYQVTNLDRLLLRVLESELAGERIEPNPAEIIREVGNYNNGVCTDQ